MTYEEIMGLTRSKAESKFGANLRKEIGKLIRMWHPDINPDPRAREVIAVLTRVRSGTGTATPSSLSPRTAFTRADGTQFGLRPLSTFSDGSAEVIVCEHSVSRIYAEQDADLAGFEIRNIQGFTFADTSMKDEMTRFLPELPKITSLQDGRVMHTFARRRDEMPLSDLLRHTGKMEIRNAAWIVSGLLNIACWLFWSKTMNGGIRPETVMVSPEFHDVRLLGWEFATPLSTRPIALPTQTLRLFPSLAAPKTVPPADLDLSMIREVLFTMCGIPHASAMMAGGAPDAIAKWATFAPNKKGAFTDYANWKTALREAYGKPTFIDMGITPEDIYGS